MAAVGCLFVQPWQMLGRCVICNNRGWMNEDAFSSTRLRDSFVVMVDQLPFKFNFISILFDRLFSPSFLTFFSLDLFFVTFSLFLIFFCHSLDFSFFLFLFRILSFSFYCRLFGHLLSFYFSFASLLPSPLLSLFLSLSISPLSFSCFSWFYSSLFIADCLVISSLFIFLSLLSSLLLLLSLSPLSISLSLSFSFFSWFDPSLFISVILLSLFVFLSRLSPSPSFPRSLLSFALYFSVSLILYFSFVVICCFLSLFLFHFAWFRFYLSFISLFYFLPTLSLCLSVSPACPPLSYSIPLFCQRLFYSLFLFAFLRF